MQTVIKNAGFRRLWFSQIVLTLGDALMRMGLLELFSRHGLDVQVETAKILFALSLPGLVLGPLAMTFLDRWQRRSVLIMSDVVRALLVIGMVVWLLPLLSGRVEQRGLLLVYLAIGVIGTIATFYLPARSALVPNLIEANKLVTANTLFGTSLVVTAVAGSALGGFVAETMGVTWAVLTNALAYCVSVALLLQIKMEPHATTDMTPGNSRSNWREFKTGVLYLWDHPTAMPLAIMAAVFAFLLGILMVVFIGYAKKTLGLGTAGVGYLIGVAGVGAGVGIGLLNQGKPWVRSNWLPFGQLLLVAAALMLLSHTTSMWLVVPVVMVLGMVAATVMINIDAKMQAQIEETRRGAVFAARGALTSLTMCCAFGLQIWTSILRDTPAPTVMWWLGLGTLAAGLLTLAAMRVRVSSSQA